VNKPDSGKGPLVDHRETRVQLHCLEQGRQAAVALMPHPMIATVPRRLRSGWEELNVDLLGNSNNIPYQLTPASLLRHVIWTRCKKYLERGYAGEEVFDPACDNSGSLPDRLTKGEL